MTKHAVNAKTQKHNYVGQNTEISLFILTYFPAVHLSPAPGVAFKQFRRETPIMTQSPPPPANQLLTKYPETNNAIDSKKIPSQKPM